MTLSARRLLPFLASLLLAVPALAGGYAVGVDGTLYAMDCATPRGTRIGAIRCGGEALTLTDLGTGPRGRLYGIDGEALYLVNLKDPGASTRVGAHGLRGPYGFCISPDGVGYVNTVDGGFYTIDLESAHATLVGPMGGGFRASGDLVFAGRALLSSVKDGAGRECLVSIDPKTGKATLVGAIHDASGANVADVFGLIYEDGTLYGLTAGGSVLRIDPKTAAATLVDWMDVRFWGASDALLEF